MKRFVIIPADPITHGEWEACLHQIKNGEEVEFLLPLPSVSAPFQERKELILSSMDEEKALRGLVGEKQVNIHVSRLDSLGRLEIKPEDVFLVHESIIPPLSKMAGIASLLNQHGITLLLSTRMDPKWCYSPYPDHGIRINSTFTLPCCEKDVRDGAYLDVVPSELDVMVKKNLYFIPFLRSMMKEKRFLHSVSVAKTAYEIALHNDLDTRKALQAGLFHDCGKEVKDEEAKRIIQKHFPEFLPLEEFCYHQFTGRYLTKHVFNCLDEDILSAIEFHCTGRDHMTPLMECIYAADKVEPLRDFPTKEKREACLRSLKDGFQAIIDDEDEYFRRLGVDNRTSKLTALMYQDHKK